MPYEEEDTCISYAEEDTSGASSINEIEWINVNNSSE
jgi:hypothetical protein